MWKIFFIFRASSFVSFSRTALLSLARLTDGKFASSPERMRQLKRRSHLKSNVEIEVRFSKRIMIFSYSPVVRSNFHHVSLNWDNNANWNFSSYAVCTLLSLSKCLFTAKCLLLTRFDKQKCKYEYFHRIQHDRVQRWAVLFAREREVRRVWKSHKKSGYPNGRAKVLQMRTDCKTSQNKYQR